MIGRRLAATLALLLFTTAPAAEPAEPAAHPRDLVFEASVYQPPGAARRSLASGPTVHLAPDRSLPLVEVAIALRAGSFLESKAETGLAELSAALLRRGGAVELDPDALDERLDSLGAELEVVGGERRSGLRLSVPSWELPRALDLVFDLLARPRLDEERLEVLRTNLTESMSRRNQDPLAVLQREWAWLLFGDFYASRRMTPATLGVISRETIDRFLRAYWRPENLILAVSGDFDPERTLTEIEARLETWRRDLASPAKPVPWPPPVPGEGFPPGLYLAEHSTPQAKVLLGHQIAEPPSWGTRERAAIVVLQEVLGGGGAVSRLSGRLRTATGLVYRTWANIEPGPDPPGYFRVFFETDPGKTARALELAIQEIERLRAQLVHPRELEIVRRTLLDRVPGYFDTAEKVAGRSSENELLGRDADYWSQHLEQLRQISREDVRRAATDHLRPDQLRILVVAPMPSEEERGELEDAAGHQLTPLPQRDPLTLVAVEERGGE